MGPVLGVVDDDAGAVDFFILWHLDGEPGGDFAGIKAPIAHQAFQAHRFRDRHHHRQIAKNIRACFKKQWNIQHDEGGLFVLGKKFPCPCSDPRVDDLLEALPLEGIGEDDLREGAPV